MKIAKIKQKMIDDHILSLARARDDTSSGAGFPEMRVTAARCLTDLMMHFECCGDDGEGK